MSDLFSVFSLCGTCVFYPLPPKGACCVAPFALPSAAHSPSLPQYGENKPSLEPRLRRGHCSRLECVRWAREGSQFCSHSCGVLHYTDVNGAEAIKAAIAAAGDAEGASERAFREQAAVARAELAACDGAEQGLAAHVESLARVPAAAAVATPTAGDLQFPCPVCADQSAHYPPSLSEQLF